MTYKEKRDHKFKILFMYYAKNGNIDSIISNYFENYPYESDEENTYIYGSNSSHKNISNVTIKSEEDTFQNESDKAVTLTITDEDNIYDITQKVQDVIQKTDEIDEMIKKNLESWDIKRVGKAELTIIRLALYEMYYDNTIDIPVAINEAVELAKTYCDQKADKFVNGVLATIYKSKIK